jgi:hypothetical protein
MSVISRVAATPNRFDIIIRVLSQSAQNAMERDELLSLISPPNLVPNAPNEGPDTTATNSLLEAIALGIVAQEARPSEKITLADSFRGARPLSLLSYLEPILVGARTDGNTGQENMSKMLEWLLEKDPRAPIDLYSNLSAETDGILNSNATAQQFAYWARFLGYAWHFRQPDSKWWLVPDPTAALARHLPRILGGEGEAQLSSLPRRWAAHCPVLEGGQHRPFDAADPQFSRATSLALLRLHKKGIISLTRQADAHTSLLSVGDGTESFSHVALTQQASAS